MKKKATVVSMILILSIIMTGCSWSSFVKKLPWNKSESVSEYDPEEYLTQTDYKGVEVDVTVSEDEVQNELNTLLSSNQTSKKAKHNVAKKGDIVKIDFEGTVDKKKFDGGTAEDQELELGSGKMIPGFEDGIVGMKVGKTKDVKVTFPKDYQEKTLQGKKANFKIKLRSIIEKTVPKATDANIAKFTDFKTLDEFKSEKKKELVQKKKDEASATAFKSYIDSVKMENAPEALLKKQEEFYDKYWRSYLSYYGYDFDTYLTQENMTEEQYAEQLKTIAKDLAKRYLAIRYIIEQEGVEITDKDKEAHIEKLKTNYGAENKEALVKLIKDYYGMELDPYVIDTFYEEKAIEIVRANAKFKE